MSGPIGELCFVVPPLDGPISGGTLYNRELCAALRELGQRLQVRPIDDPDLSTCIACARHTWVDSLYLATMPKLEREAPGRVALLAHYLPSFVELGRAAASSSELSHEESAALGCASAVWVTSSFMREAIEPLVATQKSVCVVEPGSHARARTAADEHRASGTRAVLIGNLVPGKGVLELLTALGARVQSSDRFTLSIVGSSSADAVYAARCQGLLERSLALKARVTLRGALLPPAAQRELANAQLLLSASRMESYGMALAEARVTGVPLLALAGGNTAEHVDGAAGGQLVSSIDALACAFLDLVRAPQALERRIAQARGAALPPRAWQKAAQEWLNQLVILEK